MSNVEIGVGAIIIIQMIQVWYLIAIWNRIRP